MARAVVVNAAQLASYSQSKQFLLDSGEAWGTRGGGGGASPKICDPSSYFWGFPPTQGISATISSATSAPA